MMKNIKKTKMHKTYDSDTDESSSSYEYDDDATPGPGYYTYDPFSNKNFRSKKIQYQKIFSYAIPEIG